MSKDFPFAVLQGTPQQIGEQHGEQFRSLIQKHLALAQQRLTAHAKRPMQELVDTAALFRQHVIQHAPFLDEELQGLARGANLHLSEAYMLQLRAELTVLAHKAAHKAAHESAPDHPDANECTTFVIGRQATADGDILAGQNADLPSFYSEIGIVLEIIPEDAPALLMFTPAGQISYFGMNNRGLAFFGNYLTCDHWRVGFPRYLLTRVALQYDTVREALAAIQQLDRASSRNLLMVDATGDAVSLETTPTDSEGLLPEGDVLVHTNHYRVSRLQAEERAPERYFSNSVKRLDRISAIMDEKRGQITLSDVKTLMRDRNNAPDAICVEPGDEMDGVSTVAAMIAEPDAKCVWIAPGPPNQHEFKKYTFSK